jgi:hypothetical protein
MWRLCIELLTQQAFPDPCQCLWLHKDRNSVGSRTLSRRHGHFAITMRSKVGRKNKFRGLFLPVTSLLSVARRLSDQPWTIETKLSSIFQNDLPARFNFQTFISRISVFREASTMNLKVLSCLLSFTIFAFWRHSPQ